MINKSSKITFDFSNCFGKEIKITKNIYDNEIVNSIFKDLNKEIGNNIQIKDLLLYVGDKIIDNNLTFKENGIENDNTITIKNNIPLKENKILVSTFSNNDISKSNILFKKKGKEV